MTNDYDENIFLPNKCTETMNTIQMIFCKKLHGISVEYRLLPSLLRYSR